MANQVVAKKSVFQFGHEKYEAYWNGKEYAKGIVYMNVTRVGGTMQHKGSYSRSEERFVDYKAGDLDLMRAAAKALDITE